MLCVVLFISEQSMPHLLANHILCFLVHAVLFQILSSLAQKPHFTGSCFEIIQSKTFIYMASDLDSTQ
jgi:hypothetical protein